MSEHVDVPREVVAKAISAYYRYTQSRGAIFQQPDSKVGGEKLPNGRLRFNLTNGNGKLATYSWTGKRLVRVAP